MPRPSTWAEAASSWPPQSLIATGSTTRAATSRGAGGSVIAVIAPPAGRPSAGSAAALTPSAGELAGSVDADLHGFCRQGEEQQLGAFGVGHAHPELRRAPGQSLDPDPRAPTQVPALSLELEPRTTSLRRGRSTASHQSPVAPREARPRPPRPTTRERPRPPPGSGQRRPRRAAPGRAPPPLLLAAARRCRGRDVEVGMSRSGCRRRDAGVPPRRTGRRSGRSVVGSPCREAARARTAETDAVPACAHRRGRPPVSRACGKRSCRDPQDGRHRRDMWPPPRSVPPAETPTSDSSPDRC